MAQRRAIRTKNGDHYQATEDSLRGLGWDVVWRQMAGLVEAISLSMVSDLVSLQQVMGISSLHGYK